MNVALPPQRLNVISLCTGGGGLDLGIGLALPAAHPVVLVEREAFAVAHLVAAIEQGLLAEAAIWSDVRTFDGRPFRGLVDGLIGGIPCQPHSLAGKRKGQDDERDLWSAARRIIVHARPWFVVIENVEGMLSSGGAARVVGDLRKLGFTVEIGLFSATEAGASHQRNRVFIVAVADDAGRRWSGTATAGERHRYARPDRGCGRELDDAISRGRTAGRLDHGSDVGNVAGATGEQPLADSGGARLQGSQRRGSSGERDGQEASGSASELRGTPLVNPSIIGRREGRTEPEFRSGRDTAAGASEPVADASGGLISIEGRGPQGRDGIGSASPIIRTRGDLGLFPPGPSDIDRWRSILERAPHLEPAVRRLADGVASKVDNTRIDELRLLGNGVVPLQAAYAVRTLAHRLAQNGNDRLWRHCHQ